MFTKAEALEERFRAAMAAEGAEPTFNAAPSQEQLTVLSDNPGAIVRAVWGFVPEWADNKPDVKPVINARAESIATKPFFRAAFKHQRCLVLADGFYEWRRTREGKRPYRIALKTEEPFAFAGLWSSVHDRAGNKHITFAIVTTEANTLVAQIHERMPVMLQEHDEADWLNPHLPPEEALAMLAPFPAELMTAYAVSSKVNSPAFNTPEALQPV
jgi:putative SOS response-associated peptidase YedK